MSRAALTAGLLLLTGWALSGATCSDIVPKVAAVTAAAPAACQDLAALGGTVSVISSQVAAANPGSAKAQAIAAKVAGGSVVTNADCQMLAALAPLASAGVQAGAAVAATAK